MSDSGTLSLLAGIVFLVLWMVVWSICLLGWRTARIRYAHPNIPSRLSKLPVSSAPGVTIIRPLCGLDQNLYNTLESVMKLDYPKFEVIFAVQDEKDEALPVVNMVMEKYPEVEARVIIDSRKVGVNPKVNNLMTPFQEAKYDLLWILDSTCSVLPGTLGRSVEAFFSNKSSTASPCDPESSPLLSISDDVRKPPIAGEVGLVHQVPIAVCYQKTWGSLIEQAYLNTTHAKMYLAINTTAIDSCVVGKSCMYSRDNISHLTTPSPSLRSLPDPPSGLAGFGPFLAEDNMIGLSLWHEFKLKHAMTSDVVLDFIGALSVRDYINRRIRWIRVRKKMTLAATLLEPLTESIISGLYGAWAISRLLGGNILPIFLIHMVAWISVDLSTKRALETNIKGIGPPENKVRFLMAWAARECLALPIWMLAMTSSEVIWRGQKYKIIASGEAIRLGNGN
ncbi:ceramide glucosyltransferase [Cryptococcus gattii Ru294]|uniref:Ceramide glucosyltransferase n=2 Tax=Cryptococcus gattii TaxID=37769 RepID=E6RE76_CRYGW|nr:Ceramide glucosyltransferase, putative [Cryptococcus gattii WM276]ADV25270.1 Ceramide glucosyltransferase, putative [Cryptococcus gattii WM276]KIR52286.1 ceramide glucosyltransferase [Cryptococcus gattii Ru294]KIR76539.1 ceramide glucosyltransferase [Cryptococcus gattii EJB2]KIY32120.1 ceramide glucosyltransferase [Cryptococcus gattii E566]